VSWEGKTCVSGYYSLKDLRISRQRLELSRSRWIETDMQKLQSCLGNLYFQQAIAKMLLQCGSSRAQKVLGA